MELSEEKSIEQAEIIKMISVPIICLDVDYCRRLAAEFIKKANIQNSMIVLNPSHSPIKNEILQKQGHALNFLVEYVEALKKVDALKIKLKKEESIQHEISKMFI